MPNCNLKINPTGKSIEGNTFEFSKELKLMSPFPRWTGIALVGGIDNVGGLHDFLSKKSLGILEN